MNGVGEVVIAAAQHGALTVGSAPGAAPEWLPREAHSAGLVYGAFNARVGRTNSDFYAAKPMSPLITNGRG